MNDERMLSELLLVDSDGEAAIIVNIEGSEKGHDHLKLFTQSPFQKEHGIMTELKIYSTEVKEPQ